MPRPKPLRELIDRHEDAIADLEAHHVEDLDRVHAKLSAEIEATVVRSWRRVVGDDLDAEATPQQLDEIARMVARRVRRLIDGALTDTLDVVARAGADGAVMGTVHARRELGTWEQAGG